MMAFLRSLERAFDRRSFRDTEVIGGWLEGCNAVFQRWTVLESGRDEGGVKNVGWSE